MTLKTRLILLGICALVFFIITPYIVLYSLGYRVNFETWQIRGTGGIYVYAVPAPSSIEIDSKITDRIGLFSTAVFVQNLIPGPHSVLIKKDGYYDYQKNLRVLQKEVTKLENVILFKQKMNFALLESAVDYFSVSPNENIILTMKIDSKKIDVKILNLENNQQQAISLPVLNGKISHIIWPDNRNKTIIKTSEHYYLLDFSATQPTITLLPLLANASQINFNPQAPDEIFFIKGKDLYSTLKTLPMIKNVTAYAIENQTITWLSYDGFLHESNTTGAATQKISQAPFAIKTGTLYQLKITQEMTFLKEGDTLFFLDEDLKTFQTFEDSVKELKSSPDNQKIVYFNDHEISISSLQENHQAKTVLDTYVDTIRDVHWLNNDYLIILTGDTIILCEIDNRGNLNKVRLPSTLPLLQGETIAMKNPEIFLRQQDKKLYIFTQKNIIISEKLVP